ncbi:MAG: dihydroneopterin aldolase [Fibrobacteria bacterium]|nr:dihydroneopterin aldolase [Fibrobacteria bacterium]
MIGTIELDRIGIRCIVGIHDFERIQEQDIGIDVSMDLDFAPAAASECVEDTIDYTLVASTVRDLAVEGRFQLIETLAERAASLILEKWPRVQVVRVVVHKPAAVPAARDTRVRVERRRQA